MEIFDSSRNTTNTRHFFARNSKFNKGLEFEEKPAPACSNTQEVRVYNFMNELIQVVAPKYALQASHNHCRQACLMG